MLNFSMEKIDPKLQKKLLIGGVIPRPVALVVTQSEEGVVNLAPFSYFNIASYNPPVLSVAIQRHEDGRYKDTARNLMDTGQAVVHIVDRTLLEGANQTAAPLAPQESELKRTQWSLRPGSLIDVPVVAQAKLTYECECLTSVTIEAEDGQAAADLWLLKVLGTQVAEEVYDAEREYILADRLDPMSRLAGQDYASLGDQWTLDRPQR